MTDVVSSKPGTPGSPKKRVTMSAGRESRTPTSADYRKPIVRSAVRRWKRLHEQNMMEKLVGMRNEKKQTVKASKEDAKKIARKIPIEVLAKEWLNDNEATLEVRAYLVDKVLPTLILGVEKLLNEADKLELTEDEESSPNFNPINFLAQYLMRNNPRYSNFSEASPYVRGLREVAEELKKQLFNIEDNRLARIKAEAKRRREERDRLEKLRQEEQERREKSFMNQFSEWNAQHDGRVELSLVQNALRSFVEIAENFPEEWRTTARLSRALEPTDETGKALTVKEFAKYLGMFVEDFSKDIFDEFMVHLAKCAKAHQAASNRESRRILLTNLFMSCDHSGIGLLDRHRILSLFEKFWDVMKDDIKRNLRNPRKWPVVEVDEVIDLDDDNDFDFETEPASQGQQQTVFKDTLKPESSQEDKKDEVVTQQTEQKSEAPPSGENQDKTEDKKEEQTEQAATETSKEVSKKTEEQKEVKADVKPEESKETKAEEKKEEAQEQKPAETPQVQKPAETPQEQKPAETPQEQKPAETPQEQKPAETPQEQKPAETPQEKKAEETPDKKVEEKSEAKVEEKPAETQDKVAEEKTDEKAGDKPEDKEQTEKGDGVEKLDIKESEDKAAGPETTEEGAQNVTSDAGPGQEQASQDTVGAPQITDRTDITSGPGDQYSVTFAEGTTFEREKTALTTISKTSGASAFDENSLNVSQFVQLTETFLGEDPINKPMFDELAKSIKGGYEETEEEKMERLMKARKEALSSQRKNLMDSLFEKWDNDGAGYLDLDEVETVMQKYKEGQENEAIERAKVNLKKQAKYAQDNRLSKREFRQFITLVSNELPGADNFDYFVEFLTNSVERTYAERIRGEARKKWLQQIVTAAETGGASLEPVYKASFSALYKDAEAHGGGKRVSANISMLEKNSMMPNRGDVCLRYVAATMDDADFLLGKVLYTDMKGISFAAVESGKPIHVPRVYNHGNLHFWNPYRVPEDREGSFIVVPLQDKRKRVFGLLGIDTLNDRHTKTIFITHEIMFFQGVAKSFSIAYHYIDMRKKLLRITESAVSWIHRRSPHVREITTYMVEPDGKEKDKDYILRRMMVTDAKGNVVNINNPPRLERKDNLFRDYLFKCVDNSESVSADAYGQRHIGFPLRDDQGRAVAVVDISIGELKILPNHENKEVQRMLRLLQMAHKEITRESAGDDKLTVLEAEKNDDSRMDIMFDRLMLMELRENVAKIDAQSFAELRSYNDPPPIIGDIVKAVCAIFYYEKAASKELDNWADLRVLLTQELLQKIEQYDPTSTQNLIPPEKIEIFLKDVPHGEVGKFGSIPAQNMYNWVFVCLSLIEHTLKMRENANEGVVATSNADKRQQEMT